MAARGGVEFYPVFSEGIWGTFEGAASISLGEHMSCSCIDGRQAQRTYCFRVPTPNKIGVASGQGETYMPSGVSTK